MKYLILGRTSQVLSSRGNRAACFHLMCSRILGGDIGIDQYAISRRVSSVDYERKTPLEHILLRPGMYIGQTELATLDTYVYDKKGSKMEKEKLSVSPALLKIFDEIIVNAVDNIQRDKSMTRIDIDVNKTSPNG